MSDLPRRTPRFVFNPATDGHCADCANLEAEVERLRRVRDAAREAYPYVDPTSILGAAARRDLEAALDAAKEADDE